MKPAVLFVDDDRSSLESIIRAAVSVGLDALCRTAGTAPEALRMIETERPHVVVLDLSLEPKRGVESGFDLLSEITHRAPDCRTIVLTGHGDETFGVRALDLGASSFLTKPADIAHLVALIKDGITQARLRRDYATLRHQIEPTLLTGESAAMSSLMSELRTLAATGQPVLLSGETGTGKGVAARALHLWGPRAPKSLVRYQPTFATPDLVQSDLFGHVKGAFTGATTDRRGLIAEANGGTLFLDEVDELPHETQVLLLGVLQDKRFRPVGSSSESASHFRLVCATNRDLAEITTSGKLRLDLYHRLAHCVVRIPPLRERRTDIPLLVDSILSRLAATEGIDLLGLSDGALDLLLSHEWPGNIRELEGVMESAAYRARAAGRDRIEPSDIRLRRDPHDPHAPTDFHAQVEQFKRQLVAAALARTGGNRLRAAAELGLDRGTLSRILKSSGEIR